MIIRVSLKKKPKVGPVSLLVPSASRACQRYRLIDISVAVLPHGLLKDFRGHLKVLLKA